MAEPGSSHGSSAASGLLRDPRGVREESGAFQGGVPPWKALGASLDGAVRTARSRSPALDSIAARVLEVWSADPALTVEIQPTSLGVGGRVAVSAGADEGRWMLPAFMGGMRSLRLTPGAVADDVVRLARELASLEPNLEAIHRFRDWIWSDGAEGFEVVVDASFTEAVEHAFLDEAAQRTMLASVRAEAANALSEAAVRIETRDLDRVAWRREFQVPMEALARRAGDGSLRLDPAEAEELSARCDESRFWIESQVLLALSEPSVREAVPPKDLARRILSLVNRTVDAHFLEVFGGIAGRQDADLEVQIERLLGDQGAFAEGLPGSGNGGFGDGAIQADAHLSATVVAAASDLEKDLVFEGGDSGLQLGLGTDHAEGADGKAVVGQPGLLQGFVLNDADGLDAGAQRSDAGDLAEGIDADLLDLQRDGGSAGGQPLGGFHIIPFADDDFIDNEAGGALGRGVHHADAIAHGAGGHGCHAAQLAATKKAKQCAGLDDRYGRRRAHAGSSCSRTSRVPAARH